MQTIGEQHQEMIPFVFQRQPDKITLNSRYEDDKD